MSIGRYDFKELFEKATATTSTLQDLKNLGEWFERFDNGSWNGEGYDCEDGEHVLYPVVCWFPDGEDGEVIAYTFSKDPADRIFHEANQ